MRTLAAISLLLFTFALATAQPHSHIDSHQSDNAPCASCQFRSTPGEIASLPSLELGAPALVEAIAGFDAPPRSERRLSVAPKQGPPLAVAG